MVGPHDKRAISCARCAPHQTKLRHDTDARLTMATMPWIRHALPPCRATCPAINVGLSRSKMLKIDDVHLLPLLAS